jgi:hypothetical protein
MTYPHVGPKRDHLRLDAAEQRVLVELEGSLRPATGLRGRWTGWRRGRGLLLLVRLTPWLIPLGSTLMVVALPVSVPLSFVGSLLMAVGLAATLDRVARRVRSRRRADPRHPHG